MMSGRPRQKHQPRPAMTTPDTRERPTKPTTCFGNPRGTVGDAYDNAMAESFFATLECELLNRRTFHSQAEAGIAIFRYIEGWYNPHRRHSSIGQMSPVTYERVTANAASHLTSNAA